MSTEKSIYRLTPSERERGFVVLRRENITIPPEVGAVYIGELAVLADPGGRQFVRLSIAKRRDDDQAPPIIIARCSARDAPAVIAAFRRGLDMIDAHRRASHETRGTRARRVSRAGE